VETILCNEEKFLMTSVLTPQLYWFKTKMMHAINNNLWDPFCKSPSGYYVKCGIVDKAMGLWILHFRDYISGWAIKLEIMDINKNFAQGEEETNKETNSKKRKGESHIQNYMVTVPCPSTCTHFTRKNYNHYVLEMVSCHW